MFIGLQRAVNRAQDLRIWKRWDVDDTRLWSSLRCNYKPVGKIAIKLKYRSHKPLRLSAWQY